MTTAGNKILAEFSDRDTSFTTSEVMRKVEAGQSAIYCALSKLVAAGKLVRISTGVFAMPRSDAANGAPAAPPPPAKPPTAVKRRAAAPVATPEPAPEHLPDEPAAEVEPEPAADWAPLQWAIWNDGQLLIQRGDATVAMRREEFRELVDWVARVPV